MTTWRDRLMPASFRGIGFFVDTDSVPVGRKGQLHEFPQRDEPYFESLGKESQIYTMEAFLVGDDCFERRDRLLEALEVNGAGELVHPWLGRMQVQVGGCILKHNRTEGGVVRLSLKFYPDQPLRFPTSTVNTRRQLVQASDGLLASALKRYKAVMSVVDAVRINIQALRSTLSGIFAVIQRQFTPFMTIYSDVTSLVHSLVNAPLTLSTMFSSFFASFDGDSSSGNSSRAGSSASFNASTGSGSGTGTNAGTATSGSASSNGSSVNYRATISDATQQAESIASINLVNQGGGLDTGSTAQATANLVQDALLVKVARVVASMPVATAAVPIIATPSLEHQVVMPVDRAQVPVADDVIELRDTLSSAIWEASLKADPEHYLALNTLRQALIRHLNAVAASGVRLVDIKVAEPLPALVLAYRRFGDATRLTEVVQRNRVQHPGFLPPGTLKVAQE
ncbi:MULTISPECIES: DNA circularization protein [Pseudomonas]|uniref:DNA circulation n=2 Tax=Pseudomonas cichorii TaxID=36746 RepID=A0A3M4WCD6_PSECI|nr:MULTISPECIES: DNA circularization N-terminal domain-containing protein [Pseudomonas]QVE16685.1 DNA circularization N-terminal domain-containing protein [Pseudomonas cichorii]RMR61701.1 DNA circulation [Pseudomonas cichorii]SDP03669.1 Mu-like prophage DNA circulation protein [Pseudomonas cichorii]GFM68565.1 2-hydroxyacid dehydrogenase [Pseudomonas cichorii]GFM78759.1 2-hydroxyacid dehydrogenase [Pseudomonas cichorii]